MTASINIATGQQIAATDPRPRTMPAPNAEQTYDGTNWFGGRNSDGTARIAAAQANQAAFDAYRASALAHRGCPCGQCKHS
jgi:hypothetical protein